MAEGAGADAPSEALIVDNSLFAASWSSSVDCGSSSRHLSSRDFVYWSMSSQQPRSRNSKRARVDEEATKEEDQDVRLCAALRGLLGGSKYVKQSELSREVLLSYAIQKGDVVPVTLFTVTVEPLAGDIFDVKMEEKQNSVKQLRLLIQQEQGTPLLSQALFLLPKSGKTEEASEFPMTDEQVMEGPCSGSVRSGSSN